MLNACNYGGKGIMQACMIHSWVQKSFTLVSDTFKQIPIILHTQLLFPLINSHLLFGKRIEWAKFPDQKSMFARCSVYTDAFVHAFIRSSRRSVIHLFFPPRCGFRFLILLRKMLLFPPFPTQLLHYTMNYKHAYDAADRDSWNLKCLGFLFLYTNVFLV